jgi:tRNA1Val (adenine37-N6)-methyltransferase
MVTTEGHLLNGRILYRQPASGFRSGIEPVLLAASVPARAGEHVLEAGTGAGAALLCLSARVPGVYATGVEMEPGIAALAIANAQANGFCKIDIVTDRIETASLPRLFDHAMANPPYHQEGGPTSSDAAREIAKRGSASLLHDWIARLSARLRRHGSLTLIVTAGTMTTCLAAMSESRCTCTAIYPLWPKAERPAKLVLLRGLKDSRRPLRLMPGMVLHRQDGSFSEAATAVLGDAAALPLDA